MGTDVTSLAAEEKQESQIVEWKWSWHDEFLKWLCGYANMRGGTLCIGVNDDGYVVGVENTKKMLEDIPNKIRDKLGILASVEVRSSVGAENVRYGENIPGNISSKMINQYACGLISSSSVDQTDSRYKALLDIEKENTIWESNDGIREYLAITIQGYPYAISCDGKYYKRSGSTLQVLNGFELQNFLLERAGKTWDSVPIPNVSIKDLSPDALNAFRKKVVKNGRMKPDEVNVSDEVLLHNLKLIEDGYLTRAALLMFHPVPEMFATGAYIKIGYFGAVGTIGDRRGLYDDLQYHDTVDGPIISQVDEAIDIIYRKYFKALIDYEGIQRTETYMLSEGILREILLNAINHKDYATGVPIQVSVFDDHIEVFNMGEWPKRVPSDMRVFQKHDSIPRNPKIADVSFRSGDSEAWGRGFIRIKEECERINAPLPVINTQGEGVSVSAEGCEQYIRLLKEGQFSDSDEKKGKNPLNNLNNDNAIYSFDKYLDDKTEEHRALIEFLGTPRTRQEIQEFCGISSSHYFRDKLLVPLVKSGEVVLTIPDKPTSPNQKYICNT